ncbi:MAG: hypothetical protein L3J79_12945, partial [Candidatus Marinimicrobia bacterium]|nr:hypothetical protein [Candidatus Neomarinimicrobiota bacterium]
MDPNKLIKFFTVCTLMLLFVFIGCESVSEEDQQTAIALVDSANTSVESIFSSMLALNPDSVQNILEPLDFSTGYGLYLEAHNLDSENDAANYGLAMMSLFIISQDQQFQNLLEPYYEIQEPFTTGSSPAKTIGYGFGLPLSSARLHNMVKLFIELPVSMSKTKYADIQSVNDLQAQVKNDLLPLTDEALTALDYISDSSYVFELSSSIQFGPADAIALEMSLTALRGIFNMVIAYNLDLGASDSAGIVAVMNPGGSFATLTSGGAADLETALASANAALDKALGAINQIESTGPYSGSLIQVSANDYPAFRDGVALVQTILEGAAAMQLKTRDLSAAEQLEHSINVAISQFYENPVLDFKTLLPGY